MAGDDRPATGPSDDPDATRLLLRADPPSRLPRGTRLREFEVEDIVGEGGFSIVYAALDLNLHRRVALKEYMPTALARRRNDRTVQPRDPNDSETFELGRRSFVNEARLLAQFDHPALIKVHQFWEQNGTAYMVMPLYEGRTLKRWLKERKGPPAEEDLLRIVVPLLDALEHLHAASVYHRDIAPDNVLLQDDDRPVLLDFGAARKVLADSNRALTAILKTSYAPIEQYADMAQLRQGPWTDVYALCAVLYLALTGAPPPSAVARSINDRMVPAAKAAAGRCSAGFLRAVDAGLAVRPGERPQSIAQFRELLLSSGPATLRGSGTAPQEPAATFVRSVNWRGVHYAALVAVFAVLGAAGLGVWLNGDLGESERAAASGGGGGRDDRLAPPLASPSTVVPEPERDLTRSSAAAPPAAMPAASPVAPAESMPAAGQVRATAPDPLSQTRPATTRRGEQARAEAAVAGAGSEEPRRAERSGAQRPAPESPTRARCLRILQRMQLGELPSADEKAYLQKECS
jgi:hypothetical protein